jgi:hypothetical protein
VLAIFKSPAPPYFAVADGNGTSQSITWYSESRVAQGNASWTVPSSSNSDYHAVGNSIYWISRGATSTVLYGTNGFPPATVQLRTMADSLANVRIADANSRSVLLWDGDTHYLYRVPLPAGLGSASPLRIVGSTGTADATEDVDAIYWFDSAGTLSRCTAGACTDSVAMVANQAPPVQSFPPDGGKLYQDSTALYWVNNQGQLVRLAK